MNYSAPAATVAAIITFFTQFMVRRRRRRRSSDHSDDDTSQQSDSSTSDSEISSTMAPPVKNCEVFLSFRGPDTRHSITNILYHFLDRLKIHTVRVEDEFRKGKRLWTSVAKAINRSKISIPILSRGYAESKWCLKELVKIIEHRKRDRGHIVIPIFYMVDPREVRHQTGPYESAFQRHKRNNVDAETIHCWKMALRDVGSLKGWHIRTKSEEVNVAEHVSRVVWSQLSKNKNALETEDDASLQPNFNFTPNSGVSYTMPLPSKDCEVFLSFRGPDTRGNIADILNRFLVNLKIHTFTEDSKLHTVEEIWSSRANAINLSRISIPILSQSYAGDKWCMRELVEIFEHQKRGRGLLVLPIFYMVDPRDVRHQTGPYESAFQRHRRNNVDAETIQSWKAALNYVGSLKGWLIRTTSEEVDIAQAVSQMVWSHLSRNNNALETDELVGIDDQVEQIENMLDLGSEGVNLVGIHGMGGIGKTTLAKAVYNKVSTWFDRYSFMEDVREIQNRSDGFCVLENKLISDVLRMDSVVNISEAKNIIRDRVTRFKILVVLDEVDENFNFEEIFGNLESFAPGSHFIVTSRDIKVLMRLSKDQSKLYEVQEMSPRRSLQLFCKHAFKKDFPPPDFEALSKIIVSTTGGLPLTLKVIGSLLYLEDKKVWRAKLEQLQRMPAKGVIDRLIISYNDLQYEAQQIFLDIACFHIGENKKKASYMWSDCELHPVVNINVLVQRSMIKIGDRDEFQMNNQLRDLGREIVCRESEKHPWLRSRVWSNVEAADLLFFNQGTMQVEAIKVNSSSSDVWELGSESFTNLSSLRYFHAKGTEMIVDFSHALPNLKWLELEASRINNLNMKNLVIFDVHGLEHDSGIKEASKLKVLNLFWCLELRRLPEFPESGSLEMLHIENFKNREEPLELGKLHNLKELKLQHCKLGNINGGTFGMMKGLQELHVSVDFECDLDSFRQAIVDIGELSSLQVLNVNNPHLVDVLRGIKLPESLKFLHTASGFDNLEELLDLEELDVNGTRMRLVIPHSIMRDNLKSMRLYSMEGIFMDESEGSDMLLPSSLTRLHIRCLKSERFPNLNHLGNLTELVLWECHNLTEIRGLGGLKSLQMLVIVAAGKLTRIDGLGDLMSSANCRLKELQITDCPLLRTLLYEQHDERERDSVHIESLLVMRIKGGRFLDGKSIPKLSKFPRLKELEIGESSLNIDNESGSQQHQLLEGLENLEELVDLKVHNLPKVQRLPSLSKLKKLENLALEDLPGLRQIDGLGELKSLRSIEVERCFSLERLPIKDLSYSNMDSILLDLRGCTNFTTVNLDLAPLTDLDLFNVTIHWPYEPLEWWMSP
ncbi:Disease resistance protein L6 [Linum grandiflorum]